MRTIQIPNLLVYGVLYAIVFGICAWLLVFHYDSPTNWILYLAMAWAVFGGMVKFALHWRRRVSN